MSSTSSSVKRLLRSARECLGRKDYREALQYCKEALAEDRGCYEAFMWVGGCLRPLPCGCELGPCRLAAGFGLNGAPHAAASVGGQDWFVVVPLPDVCTCCTGAAAALSGGATAALLFSPPPRPHTPGTYITTHCPPPRPPAPQHISPDPTPQHHLLGLPPQPPPCRPPPPCSYVGKAAFHLGEAAQAEVAYRRASDLDPGNPLAWQGLAEVHVEAGGWDGGTARQRGWEQMGWSSSGRCVSSACACPWMEQKSQMHAVSCMCVGSSGVAQCGWGGRGGRGEGSGGGGGISKSCC